jgi:hypothetical protein
MSTESPSILIVGRSRLVIDGAVEILRDRGVTATATNDVANAWGDEDPRELRVVVFGGQIPPERKAEIQADMEALSPGLKFVQGLAGIPGLVADQAQAALDGECLIPGQAPIFDAARRAIVLSTFAPLDVAVTVYWATEFVPPDPKSESVVLADQRLPAGEHSFVLPAEVNLDAAFATVRASGASWSFRLAK